jgi:hypothetical protein
MSPDRAAAARVYEAIAAFRRHGWISVAGRTYKTARETLSSVPRRCEHRFGIGVRWNVKNESWWRGVMDGSYATCLDLNCSRSAVGAKLSC